MNAGTVEEIRANKAQVLLREAVEQLDNAGGATWFNAEYAKAWVSYDKAIHGWRIAIQFYLADNTPLPQGIVTYEESLGDAVQHATNAVRIYGIQEAQIEINAIGQPSWVARGR